MNMRDWAPIVDLVKWAKKIVLTAHEDADGDALGSELALARFLKRQGKQVTIINPTPTRSSLEFLVKPGEVLAWEERHRKLLEAADLVMAFDIGDFNRLLEIGKVIQRAQLKAVSIDHHVGEKAQFKHVIDDAAASSTGVLVLDLLKKLEPVLELTLDLAEPLYVAIMTDTGNFRFNNTDEEAFQAASQLVAAGVRPYDLYVKLYEDINTPGRLYVLKLILERLQFAAEGRLAWVTLPRDLLNRNPQVRGDDLHGLSDFVRSIKGVEVGCVITEMENGQIDISMRSKGTIKINGVACAFGGGGHFFAAGCQLKGTLPEIEQKVVSALREQIEG